MGGPARHGELVEATANAVASQLLRSDGCVDIAELKKEVEGIRHRLEAAEALLNPLPVPTFHPVGEFWVDLPSGVQAKGVWGRGRRPGSFAISVTGKTPFELSIFSDGSTGLPDIDEADSVAMLYSAFATALREGHKGLTYACLAQLTGVLLRTSGATGSALE
eukprot:Sspe_Gene.102557::Locus_78259_Transcript_1_1_Confidence_1.000_Length_597::g.102557::m.102557